MVSFDKSLIVILLCAIAATLIIVDAGRETTPPVPVSPRDYVGFAVHPLSSSFSSAEPGARVTGSQLSVSDNVVYRMGFYSINGSSWVSFNLSGSSYNGNVNWLRGYASRSLPVFGLGEHYVLVYSCNRSNAAWDCHGNRFQLIVVNNTGSSGGSGGSGGSGSDSGSSGHLCNVSVDCLSTEYCSHGVCLLNVSGHTYFVSTDGNDANPGTFSQPFHSWQRAYRWHDREISSIYVEAFGLLQAI